MVTSNERVSDSREGQHRENLRRDGLTPPDGRDRGAAGRIVLAFLAVGALAVLGSLPPTPEQHGSRFERHALTSAAPQLVAMPEVSWSDPAR